MKKSILTLTAVALATVATPAMADSLTAEVRLGDVRNGKPNSTEYRVEYWAPLNSALNYGAELQVKQRTNEGPLKATISAKAGPALPTVLGMNVAAYGELGQTLSEEVTTKVGTRNVVTGGNHEFWGAAVKVGRQLYGPLSVTAGYRHREGFKAASGINEERLLGGLTLALGDKNAVNATYYRTRGTTDADAVGIGFTRKF